MSYSVAKSQELPFGKNFSGWRLLKRVGARGADVEDANRELALACAINNAERAVRLERGAEHQQSVTRVHVRTHALHDGARHVAAHEDDVGDEHSAQRRVRSASERRPVWHAVGLWKCAQIASGGVVGAVRTGGHFERSVCARGEHDVAVRSHLAETPSRVACAGPEGRRPAGVPCEQNLLKGFTRRYEPASQTPDPTAASVKLSKTIAPSCAVERVNILSYQPMHLLKTNQETLAIMGIKCC